MNAGGTPVKPYMSGYLIITNIMWRYIMELSENLYEKLILLSDFGVVLLLNGKPASPESVASCVNKDRGCYRARFSYSSNGDLSVLNYVSAA